MSDCIKMRIQVNAWSFLLFIFVWLYEYGECLPVLLKRIMKKIGNRCKTTDERGKKGEEITRVRRIFCRWQRKISIWWASLAKEALPRWCRWGGNSRRSKFMLWRCFPHSVPHTVPCWLLFKDWPNPIAITNPDSHVHHQQPNLYGHHLLWSSGLHLHLILYDVYLVWGMPAWSVWPSPS